MKNIFEYVKLGFGVYFGYVIAKYTDKFLEIKYNEYKCKKQEEAYVHNDIKNTYEYAKEQNTK